MCMLTPYVPVCSSEAVTCEDSSPVVRIQLGVGEQLDIEARITNQSGKCEAWRDAGRIFLTISLHSKNAYCGCTEIDCNPHNRLLAI